MKIKLSNMLKYTAHIILLIVSTVFTVTLFIQFSNHFYEKILWGMAGFALELIKLYIFMLAKKNFREGKKAMFMFSIEMITYLGLAFVSMIASMGFVLNTIQQQALEAVDTNLGRETLINDINVIDAEIANIIEQQKNLPPHYVTSSIRLSVRLQELKLEKQKLVDAVDNTKENRKVVAKDVFTLLGEQYNKSGKDTLFLIMVILIFTLEICLVLTSGDLKESLTLVKN